MAEVLRSTSRLISDADEYLRDLTVRMPADTITQIPHDRVAAIATIADDVAQLAMRAQSLGEVLHGRPLEVAYLDVAADAAADLADGVADPQRAMLAAQLLNFPEGWRALADCLRTVEVHETWHGVTVGTMLSAFRGVSPQLARQAAATANLAPGTEFTACSPDDIARLATALESIAAQRG
jgi:hypothetical protein